MVYEEPSKKDDSKKYLTVYCRVNETYYKYYPLDDYNDPTSYHKEVNWNGYILGARSLRFDFEVDKDTEVTKELIDQFVSREHEIDDVWGYHVEPVDYPEEWDTMSNEDLWAEEVKRHRRKGELEFELRQLKRDLANLWRIGDAKYNWAENL